MIPCVRGCRLRRSSTIALALLLSARLVAATAPTLACKWGDDDEETNDDAAPGDDDTADDDAGDDDLADDDTDDDDATDDDADDDTDPFAGDRVLYIPAIVEPGGEPVAVLSEVWRDAHGAHLRVRLVDAASLGVVRSGPAIDLDEFGTASMVVEDFDGDGVAEIVASLLYISADDASSRVVEIDPATLDDTHEIAFFDGELATIGALIDTDGDDVPELPVRLQDYETGRRRVAGFRHQGGAWPISGLLSPQSLDDVNFALYALPRRAAWGRAIAGAKAEGDLIVAAWDEDPPGSFFVFVSTLGDLEIADPERRATRALGAFDVAATDRVPVGFAGAYAVAFAVEGPDDSVVEIRDDAGGVVRSFSYAPDTRLRVSWGQDIDLDGAADLAIFADLPGDPYQLDICTSSTLWQARETFTGDYTSIRAIGARRPPGHIEPAALFSADAGFGLAFEVAGEGGWAQLWWYEAPFADFDAKTPQLQVGAAHLNLTAYVFDFDGDGDDEAFTVANGYTTAPTLAYAHRIRVYDDLPASPAFDSGDQGDTAYAQWPWDLDGDGAADVPLWMSTIDTRPARLDVVTGANGWGDPIFSFESEPQATVLLGGLLR